MRIGITLVIIFPIVMVLYCCIAIRINYDSKADDQMQEQYLAEKKKR